MTIDKIIDNYIKRKKYRQINSVLLWHNGEFVANCYYNGFDENSRNVIKSVAKSITSAVAGIMIDKGLLKSVDEPVYKFIPQFNEGRDLHHRMITVRHLLTMTSGIYWQGGVHYHCPMLDQMFRSDDWIGHIADIVVVDIPGTKYLYKEWDILLLAEVLNYISGDLYEFTNQNLYKLLGIESKGWFQSASGTYYTIGNNDKNEKLSDLTAMELFKIGKLFLDNGVYEDKQILSKKYIDMAIAPSPAESGYGFMWWRGDEWYGCRGYGGQSITVVPKKKLIMVTQATPTARGMGYHDLIWDIIGEMEND